jgi:galactokinase
MSETFKLPVRPLPPMEIARMLESGSPEIDGYLGQQIYANSDPDYLARQRRRLAETARLHADRVGDRPSFLIRAPGRLNAFLEYLDMCAGDHMSTTIDGDIPVAISPREDDILSVKNVNPLFPANDVAVLAEFERFAKASWESHARELEDNWDNRSLVYPHHGRPQGNWMNYVLSPFMRMLWDDPAFALRGADITFGPATAPFRAGTSSSSAIVVLSFLTMYLCNRDTLPQWSIQQVCKLLGEAEWYVGTHGGANDQMTILRNPVNSVVYNRHSKADLDATPLPFLKGIHVVLANSLWEVNKTLGGNQSFNMRKGWMQMGDELMKLIIQAVHRRGEAFADEACNIDKSDCKCFAPTEPRNADSSDCKCFAPTTTGWLAKLINEEFGFAVGGPVPMLESSPELWKKIEANYFKFGSLHRDILGIPDDAIRELLLLLPVKITPEEAGRVFGKAPTTIERIYTAPRRKIGGYHIRTTARFFHKENIIGSALEHIFLEAESRVTSGELSPDSAEYDAYRVQVGRMVDELQDILAIDFRVSNPQLDLLLTIARRGPGCLGGKLTGAGKGGCVSLLVRESESAAMCEYLDREYYCKPEYFEFYRQVLEDERRFNEPGSIEYESAQERLGILNAALASIADQRRVITFSRGACAIELG